MAKAEGGEGKAEGNVEAAQGGGDGGQDLVGAAEQGNASVQAYVDTLNEQGYDGVAGDPTPRENYTVAGVTSGAPTPETDPGAAEDVRLHQNELASRNSK